MKYVASCLILFLGLATSASAVIPFSIDSSNGYDGWTTSHTSGDGGQNGNFVSGSGVGGLDVEGTSWGLYANSGNTASIVYAFGDTLPVGGTVSISVALGGIDNGGTVGFGLQNSSGTNLFEAYFVGGQSNWQLNDAGGPEDIAGVAATWGDSSWSNGNYLTFEFTLLAEGAYSLAVNGTPVSNSDLTIASSDISQIRLFNYNAGFDSERNQYFNTLTVVPEPSVYAALFGLGALGLTVLRRRRV